METEDETIETFAGGSISSKDEKVPRWLFFVYALAPLWGIIWFILYWNGSPGWIDRGSWYRLQKAANTVYPIHSPNFMPDKPPPEKDLD